SALDEVVTTGPGVSRIAPMSKCNPLPERGGPIKQIDSSKDAQTGTPSEAPSCNAPSPAPGFCKLGRTYFVNAFVALHSTAVSTASARAIPSRRRNCLLKNLSDWIYRCRAKNTHKPTPMTTTAKATSAIVVAVDEAAH